MHVARATSVARGRWHGAAWRRRPARYSHVIVAGLSAKGRPGSDAGAKDEGITTPTSQSVAQSIEDMLDAGRVGINELLRGTLGLELRRTRQATSASATDSRQSGPASQQTVRDSAFWNPYAPNSPFVDRETYLKEFKSLESERRKDSYGACTIVSEDEIQRYVSELRDQGLLTNVNGLSSILLPKTLYVTVVKVVLRVVQTLFATADGQTVLGREFYLLQRKSIRAGWRPSRRYAVDEAIVEKLVRRVMADHNDAHKGVSAEVLRQMYHNVINLVFRLLFDLVDSCQLRVMGHTVSISIEVDEGLADAPGWDIPLDSGVFGRFDTQCKREFVSDLVDDLLNDESINLTVVPDVLEKQLYVNAVMLLFDLLETVGNHLRLHLAGISFRPALGDLKKRGSREEDRE